jgi:hypothetical protein
MQTYHFTIDVEMDDRDAERMWEADEEAELEGKRFPPKVCAAAFADRYQARYGVVMRVTGCSFTGDESNG